MYQYTMVKSSKQKLQCERERYRKNRFIILKQKREYRLKHHKHCLELDKNQYNKHKKEINERIKNYRKTTERGKSIRRTVMRNYQAKRRTDGCNSVATWEWERVVRQYNYCCAYCGKECYLTMDHVIPLSKGGKHVIENIVPACSECNTKKGAQLNWQPKKFRKAK